LIEDKTISKLIPRRTIDAIRNSINIIMDAVGIECTVYIPTNTSFDEANKLDVWSVPTDLDYVSYSGMVFLNWNTPIAHLKKLGLFTEGRLPITARFGNKLTSLEGSPKGQLVSVDIPIRSYFRISPEFIPSNYVGAEEFEIVNVAAEGMHDAVLLKTYSVAPRRIKQS